MFERYRFAALVTAMIAGAIVATAGGGVANATVFDTSLVDPPGFYNGIGQPNEGFTVNTVNGVEFGLGVLDRFGAAVHPTTGSVYDVSTGYYPATTLALWNVQLSINLQASGNPGLVLGAITPTLSVYDQNTNSTTSFNLFGLADNAGWNGSENVLGGSFYLSDYGFQNSLNPGYVPGFNPLATDTFVLTLSAVNSTGANIGSVQETINATPIPAALPLFASGLGVMGFLARRRKRKNAAALAAA
jgi:hypothetical protein